MRRRKKTTRICYFFAPILNLAKYAPEHVFQNSVGYLLFEVFLYQVPSYFSDWSVYGTKQKIKMLYQRINPKIPYKNYIRLRFLSSS